MPSKVFILVLMVNLLAGTKFAKSQHHNIRQLKQALAESQDTTRVNTYSELAWQYINIDLDSAQMYGRKAVQLARQIDYKRGLAQALNDLGIVWYYQAALDSAHHYFQQSLQIYQSLGHVRGIGAAYNKLGIIAKSRGQLAKAVDYFTRSTTYFDSLDLAPELAANYNNIGTLYYDVNDYDKALQYFQKALSIKDTLGDTVEIAGTLANIANIYFHQKKYPQAQVAYRQALAYLIAAKTPQYRPACYNGLGSLQELQGNYEAALEYYLQALDYADASFNTIEFKAATLARAGGVLIKMKRYEAALEYLERAEQLASDNNLKLVLMKVYDARSQLASARGQGAEALSYARQLLELKDTVFSHDRNALIAEMQARFELKEQVKANKLLAAENRIQQLEIKQANQQLRLQWLIFGGVGIGLLLLGGMGYNHLQTLRARQQALAEKERLKAIVVAEDQARKKIAMDLHDGLGQLLSTARLHAEAAGNAPVHPPEKRPHTRQAVQNALQLIDQACEELRHVSHSMMPGVLTRVGLASALRQLAQQVNSGNSLQITVEGSLPEDVPEDIAISTYRVVQEILNNTLKHAQANHLRITMHKGTTGFTIAMEEDGMGFSREAIEKSEGIGWKNIQARISMMNGQIHWHAQPQGGMRYHIEIPYTN